jgi:hypothetical protein
VRKSKLLLLNGSKYKNVATSLPLGLVAKMKDVLFVDAYSLYKDLSQA